MPCPILSHMGRPQRWQQHQQHQVPSSAIKINLSCHQVPSTSSGINIKCLYIQQYQVAKVQALRTLPLFFAPAEHRWLGDCSHNHVQYQQLPRVCVSEGRPRQARCVLPTTFQCQGQGLCRSCSGGASGALETAALAGYNIFRA